MDKLTSSNTQHHRYVKCCGYNNHTERRHEAVFCVKDIKNASKSNKDPIQRHEEIEPEITRTDADTVKELVEMKFLPKKRKIRPRGGLIHKYIQVSTLD